MGNSRTHGVELKEEEREDGVNGIAELSNGTGQRTGDVADVEKGSIPSKDA